MGSIANLVLTDATPADQTFNPVEASPQKSVWVNIAAEDSSYLRPEVICTHRRATSNGTVERTTWRLNIPRYDTVDGVKVARGTSRLIIESINPVGETDAEKDDLLAMGRDLIDETVFADAVKGKPPY